MIFFLCTQRKKIKSLYNFTRNKNTIFIMVKTEKWGWELKGEKVLTSEGGIPRHEFCCSIFDNTLKILLKDVFKKHALYYSLFCNTFF